MPLITSTPHINCTGSKFAKTVIMPGDPLRAKYIATKYLENPELVNNVRAIHGYTGYYHGKRVSVMGSGMGGPSMGIYSHELFAFMGVETIIRIGTCGGMQPNLKLGDLIIAMGACTNSNFVSQFNLPGTFSPIATYSLLRSAVNAAEQAGINYSVGNVVTMDYFYNDAENTIDWAKMGILGAEMETAILYTNAALFGKNALALLTVSDELATQEQLTPAQRETTLDSMIQIALSIAQ